MRFGLIGFGAWGRQHAQAIAGLPGLALAAIACNSEDSARAAAAAYPRRTRHARLARRRRRGRRRHRRRRRRRTTCTPTIAIAALEGGKDVLLEKPMATTVDDCDALLAAERASGRLVSVGHELRQSAQWGKVKSLLDEGAIGSPLTVNFGLFRNFYRSGADGWRYDPARVGSWLLEEAVHYFDLALWYIASATATRCRSAPSATAAPGRDAGMHDNVSVLLRWTPAART